MGARWRAVMGIIRAARVDFDTRTPSAVEELAARADR
jgi:hypothetical protein